MEDNKTLENEIVEENEVALDNIEDNENENSGIGAAIVSLLIGASIGVLIIKNKDKIKAKRIERQIKHLEKAGYEVSKIEVESDDVDSEENDEE